MPVVPKLAVAMVSIPLQPSVSGNGDGVVMKRLRVVGWRGRLKAIEHATQSRDELSGSLQLRNMGGVGNRLNDDLGTHRQNRL